MSASRPYRPTVVDLTTKKDPNPALVADLEWLLAQAKAGDIQSLIVGAVPVHKPEEYVVVLHGWTDRNYLAGLGLISAMSDFYHVSNPTHFVEIDDP